MTVIELFPTDIYNQKTISQGHPPGRTNRKGGEYDLVDRSEDIARGDRGDSPLLPNADGGVSAHRP